MKDNQLIDDEVKNLDDEIENLENQIDEINLVFSNLQKSQQAIHDFVYETGYVKKELEKLKNLMTNIVTIIDEPKYVLETPEKTLERIREVIAEVNLL